MTTNNFLSQATAPGDRASVPADELQSLVFEVRALRLALEKSRKDNKVLLDQLASALLKIPAYTVDLKG